MADTPNEEDIDESPKGSHYKGAWDFLIGKKANAETGSNTRRLISRLSVLVIIILLVEVQT